MAEAEKTPEPEPRDRLAYIGARIGLGLFRALPLDWASAFGGWLARRIGPHTRPHRTALRQIGFALPELSPAERDAALSAMWDNLGRVLAEYAHLAEIAAEDRIALAGSEWLATIRAESKPVIFFSAHFGNWELPSLMAHKHGFDLLQIYRAANNPLTEQMLQDLRKPVGGRHVPKGARAAREMLRALKNGESLAMLVDQKLNSGLAIPFFGRPAMTAPAIAEFAQRFDALLVPVHCERLEGARFRVVLEEPFRLDKSSSTEADLIRINGYLENWIRARPGHWFWVHKRWPKETR